MEVDDDDRRLRERLVHDHVDELPRRLRHVEVERAHQVHHGDLDAVARFPDCERVPRRPCARVGRPDDAVAAREVGADPVAAVRVVAERDHVGPGAQEAVGELRRDPCAVGDVLAVDDAEVGVEILAQPREPLLDGTSARDAEDVGQEEKSQFRTSDAAGRIVTETWLPASFV